MISYRNIIDECYANYRSRIYCSWTVFYILLTFFLLLRSMFSKSILKTQNRKLLFICTVLWFLMSEIFNTNIMVIAWKRQLLYRTKKLNIGWKTRFVLEEKVFLSEYTVSNLYSRHHCFRRKSIFVGIICFRRKRTTIKRAFDEYTTCRIYITVLVLSTTTIYSISTTITIKDTSSFIIYYNNDRDNDNNNNNNMYQGFFHYIIYI